MNFIKWLLAIIATILIAFSAFLFFMKFHDGPIEVFSGGPFKTGDIVQGPEPDWTQYADRATIQLQSVVPARSRTLWLVVIDDRIFIPSGFMNTRFGKIWKKWPVHAEQDGRAYMRIDDKIYPREMVRISADHELAEQVSEALTAKYPGDSMTIDKVRANDTWLFELTSRSEN